MRTKTTIACAVALALAVAGCERTPTTVGAQPGEDGLLRSTSSIASTLGVLVSGPSKSTRPDEMLNYSASVGGGSGTYHYTWTAERCWHGYGCTFSNVGTGVGVSSVQVRFETGMSYMFVTADVQDVNAPYGTGSDTKGTIAMY